MQALPATASCFATACASRATGARGSVTSVGPEGPCYTTVRRPAALRRFVVMDKVHERSSESDVLLACLKVFMLHSPAARDLKLV